MTRKLVLQDFLPYHLNRAGTRIGQMFSRDIERYGVTLPMWRVMIELLQSGGRQLGELAAQTSIEPSTLSRLLVSMQRKRLLMRRRSGQDRRALSVALTPPGVRLTEKIVPIALRYEDVAMRTMSRRDAAKLKSLLATVYNNLMRAARARTGRPPAGGRTRRQRASAAD
jgi:DNA-binding MarR family transcriptional regulator